MKRQPVTMRDFQCPECSEKISVPKKSSRRTSVGHIKDMWCWKCKETRKFIQIKY